MPADIPLYQVDAFTDTMFRGNPAAVCILGEAADADWMQSLAAEMNLAETAFLHPEDGGYRLRWFTPAVEADLCGHATLASAHVLWSERGADPNAALRFQTRSGELVVRRRASGFLEMDFPATPATPAAAPTGLAEALGIEFTHVGRSKFDVLVEVPSEAALRDVSPDFVALGKVDVRGSIVTCRSETPDFDFLSRFFAPAAGINEDPVTGSAHCCLGPFWKAKLNKDRLVGYQASQRGGIVQLQVGDDRVLLGGHAVTVFRAELRGA